MVHSRSRVAGYVLVLLSPLLDVATAAVSGGQATGRATLSHQMDNAASNVVVDNDGKGIMDDLNRVWGLVA